MQEIKVIAFDADDTLWVNEPYFQEVEQEFCRLLADYLPAEEVSKILFQTQCAHLPLYGYGIKCFTLCMIETAIEVTKGAAGSAMISRIMRLGQYLLEKPIELLEGVEDVLGHLKPDYMLVVATKGDLLDQQRKLSKSGLQEHFHHIEIMSNKKTSDYHKLLTRLNCRSEEFLMLGNSVKSDILPVLELDAFAAHIPYHTTWLHEMHDGTPEHANFIQLGSITEILPYLRNA